MTRTTGFHLALLAGCAAALQASPARAEDDTQFWLNTSLSAPVQPGLAVTVDISQRWREGNDQFLLRGHLEAKVRDWLSVGGGGAYVEYEGGHEVRPHQQVTFTTGPVAFRTRLEERFLSGADRPQIRVRERVQASLPLAPRSKAAVSAEGFYILQSQNAGGDARFDQWRLMATVTQTVSKRLEVGVGYLLIGTVRDNAPDRYSHVPQITLSAKL